MPILTDAIGDDDAARAKGKTYGDGGENRLDDVFSGVWVKVLTACCWRLKLDASLPISDENPSQSTLRQALLALSIIESKPAGSKISLSPRSIGCAPGSTRLWRDLAYLRSPYAFSCPTRV